MTAHAGRSVVFLVQVRAVALRRGGALASCPSDRERYRTLYMLHAAPGSSSLIRAVGFDRPRLCPARLRAPCRSSCSAQRRTAAVSSARPSPSPRLTGAPGRLGSTWCSASAGRQPAGSFPRITLAARQMAGRQELENVDPDAEWSGEVARGDGCRGGAGGTPSGARSARPRR